MQTLVEFVRYTKGMEYIVAIISLFAFVFLWRLLTQPLRKATDNRQPAIDMAEAHGANAKVGR